MGISRLLIGDDDTANQGPDGNRSIDITPVDISARDITPAPIVDLSSNGQSLYDIGTTISLVGDRVNAQLLRRL